MGMALVCHSFFIKRGAHTIAYNVDYTQLYGLLNRLSLIG